MSSHTLKFSLAALAVVCFPLAAQAAPAAPGSGELLQQVQPATPPAPSSSGTGLTIQQPGGATLPPSAPFRVKSIRITGNKAIDTATLHALVAAQEGKDLTLGQLGELANRITEMYRQHGYPLARAIIPAQTVRDGVVVIQVIEAHYGAIELKNSSRVHDALLQSTLAPLHSGAPIAQPLLDSRLLLLSDIPGVAINATLKPGASVGTSDLGVEAVPGAAMRGDVVLDNYGGRYTGRARLGATLDVIDPLHHGDVLSLGALTSGQGLNYGRIGYESLVNGHGTRLGGAASTLAYKLGSTLSSLHAHGTAQQISLWAKQPLRRRRDTNLYGQLRYDRLELRDRIDASGIRTYRHLDTGTVIVNGDRRDGLLAGGASAWSVSWGGGEVHMDDAAAALADAATAQTKGYFSKWNGSLVRQQRLGQRTSLHLALSGQWTHDNLDSSQKLTVGGPHSVRAYDTGALSGDSGYQGTLELRHYLGAAWGGQWQALAFMDGAKVKVNAQPWSAGTNEVTVRGAGAGLQWSGPRGWHGQAYGAATVGATPQLLGHADAARVWVELGKSF